MFPIWDPVPYWGGGIYITIIAHRWLHGLFCWGSQDVYRALQGHPLLAPLRKQPERSSDQSKGPPTLMGNIERTLNLRYSFKMESLEQSLELDN